MVESIDPSQRDVDIAAGSVGVRADNVRAVDQRLGMLMFQTGKADAQFNFDAKTVGDGADTNYTLDRCIFRNGSLSRPATNFIAPRKQAA